MFQGQGKESVGFDPVCTPQFAGHATAGQGESGMFEKLGTMSVAKLSILIVILGVMIIGGVTGLLMWSSAHQDPQFNLADTSVTAIGTEPIIGGVVSVVSTNGAEVKTAKGIIVVKVDKRQSNSGKREAYDLKIFYRQVLCQCWTDVNINDVAAGERAAQEFLDSLAAGEKLRLALSDAKP